MKKAMILIAAFAIAVVALGQELTASFEKQEPVKATGPAFNWTATTFDFGKIVKGEPVTHEFTFTNAGNDVLRGGPGSDRLDGGEGIDRASYFYAIGGVTASLTTGTASGADGNDTFDELYKGRRIQGRPASGGHQHHGGGYTVLIDGEELHVMRNADGTWISVVNHYQPHQTRRALARAAVVELQGATLVPVA